jgi:hypothetical protein
VNDAAAKASKIEIRPEVTMLSVLRHLNYKAWFAMAEFIDNAIQSFVANQARLKQIDGPDYQLTVDIKIDTSGPGLITVTDNAAGISDTDFPRAFRAAQIPDDRSGLSEFGMGMKSAACWFARSWTVRTTAVDEAIERTIKFDVRHIVENRIESLSTTVRTVDPKAHYTVVSLTGLHHSPQGRTVQKIKDHLASIYRMYTRDGRLVLLVNDEQLQYQMPTTLISVPYIAAGVPAEGPEIKQVEWRKEIDFDFGQGQRVRGFAALRETGSTPLAGFALFRRDRLIEGSHDDTYRPPEIFKQTNSYPYQRLFGELQIEGFDVSHTKDGFRWEEYEGLFLECLKEEIERKPLNLLSQAENYRALPTRRSIEQKAAIATNSVAEYVQQEVAPLIIEARQNPSVVEELPTLLLPDTLQASEKTVEVDDGLYRWIITLRTSVNPAEEQWLSVAQAEPKSEDTPKIRRLSLDVSLAHPFSLHFLGAQNENVELLLRFGTALAISLVLAEDSTGESPGTVLHHLNQLLRGTLSEEVSQ